MGGQAEISYGTYRRKWQTWSHAPGGRLAGLADYHGFVFDAGEPMSDPVLPGPKLTLILSFGDKLRMERMPGPTAGGGTFESFVAGLHDSYGVIAHDGHQAGVQVDLDPLLARALLRVPLDELTGDVVPVDAVLDRAGGMLADQIAELPDWPSRFRLLDQLLADRLSEARPAAAEVAHVWEVVNRTHGGARIDELAREVGWSRRHLASRFRAEIGVTPKTAARIVRFDRARWLLAAGRAGTLTELAAVCGFYDHAHLDREFRVLAGRPPSQLGDGQAA